MTYIKPEDTSYETFQNILNGYRLTEVCKVAHESDVFTFIGDDGETGTTVCEKAGWDNSNGLRFLDALCAVGFLHNRSSRYYLSDFSKKFFLKSSGHFQADAIAFETRLIDSWTQLKDTLVKGKKVYGVEEKTPDEYDKALSVYLGAMDNAAKIRAEEVWNSVKPGTKGCILDVGAGSGAFIIEFLTRNKSWQGIFCDLKDVVEKAKQKNLLTVFKDRISFIESNLLDESVVVDGITSDIIMLSNLVHCQGEAETKKVLANSLKSLADDGVVMIHDFFSDCGWRGGLYDIHMMLNTYNGRTYSIRDITDMLSEFGLLYSKSIQLKSGSTLLLASKKPLSDEFMS